MASSWKAWTPTTRKITMDVLLLVASQVALYYGVKWILSNMDPSRKKKESAKQQSGAVFKRLGVKALDLNEYEEIIAAEVIHPDDIHVSFKDIGGLEDTIQDLRESVIFPLLQPQLFKRSSLLAAPKGVLLYGPPGTGKTMLAKALSKESGATFINLHVSTLTEKWFGESQKLVHAVFSLAKKLEPAIVFIDEIDSFLRERRSSDHEAMSMMKAEWMALWDGMSTGENMRVLILGATNRPNDLDAAIIRRMPKRYAISMPDGESRRKVLLLLLRGIPLDEGFDMDLLVRKTNGLSGSDLKELCRNAAMNPVREYFRKEIGSGDIKDVVADSIRIRPLTMDDFFPLVNGTSNAPVLNTDSQSIRDLD
ncbi:AAA-domain-containing protein [Hyaloraphidium curvatum]|nr:AAA-domain-containing protein [Hyaloraphidium curvatum]